MINVVIASSESDVTDQNANRKVKPNHGGDAVPWKLCNLIGRRSRNHDPEIDHTSVQSFLLDHDIPVDSTCENMEFVLVSVVAAA